MTLSSCHKPRSYNYFLLHPRDLEAVYARCNALPGPVAYQDQECVSAINAAQTLRDWVLLVANNPLGFGVKLLAAQTELGKTQQALEELKKQSSTDATLLKTTQETYDRQRFDIEMMYGILRLVQPQ